MSFCYWSCHWDFERVISTLAAYYGIPYKEGDADGLEKVVTRAYMEYHGVRNLSHDVHKTSIKAALHELTGKGVVPTCVMYEVKDHTVEKRTEGFDLATLIARPPYKCDWDQPREVRLGFLEEDAYAA